MEMRDLSLSYEEALHGIQSAVRFEMTQRGIPDENHDAILRMLKHLRTGLDARAADASGLAKLLIDKGIITFEEYVEAMRLAANHELVRYEEHLRTEYGISGSFR